MIPRSMRYGHRLGIQRCYSTAVHASNRVIFFPGQGAQQIGMISDFVSNFASARRVLEQSDEYLKYPISKLIASGPPEDLFSTEHAQPAIFACSAAILSVLRDDFGVDIGKTFNWTLGHSLGEFAALWTAGVLGYEDALTICKVRGEAMRDAVVQFGGDLPTGMSALIVEPGLTGQLVKEIEAWAEKELAHSTTEVCVVANINSVGVLPFPPLTKLTKSSLRRLSLQARYLHSNAAWAIYASSQATIHVPYLSVSPALFIPESSTLPAMCYPLTWPTHPSTSRHLLTWVSSVTSQAAHLMPLPMPMPGDPYYVAKPSNPSNGSPLYNTYQTTSRHHKSGLALGQVTSLVILSTRNSNHLSTRLS